jgi:hypothetical protein
MAAPGYLELSEEQNALDYLEKVVSFIKSSKDKPVNWKWVIIAIHATLYSFMICALKGTNPDNVCIKTKNGSKLIDFHSAFVYCQDSKRRNISGFCEPIKPSEQQRQAVDRICGEFRNQFMHYQPRLWAIELSGMPDIILHALGVVRMVALEMGCYFVHYECGDAERIAALISEGQGILRDYAACQSRNISDVACDPQEA